MNNQMDRFSDPIKNYGKELWKVRTLAELKRMQVKYALILSDSVTTYEQMTEESFSEFITQLPKCFSECEPPDDGWMERFSAIVLPKLFIELAPLLQATPMPSGFVMRRLLDERMASIENGRFLLNQL